MSMSASSRPRRASSTARRVLSVRRLSMLSAATSPPRPEKPGWCAWWFGSVALSVMPATLTLEPELKSSSPMEESLMAIGELAARAGVSTSAVRYYERRGLLRADVRQSGQRRYRLTTLRRLVFIGMLQDAGLTLEEIDGILRAGSVEEWKAI